MFSTDRFYEIIYKQLIQPICHDAFSFKFKQFDMTRPCDIEIVYPKDVLGDWTEKYRPIIFFNDEEPFYLDSFNNIFSYTLHSSKTTKFADDLNHDYSVYNGITLNTYLHDVNYFRHHFLVYATSEKSIELENNLKTRKLYNWYYFKHGFIALDWFRHAKYLPANYTFDKVFISFNNLVTGNRNYRLNFVSKLAENMLLSYGYVSLNTENLDTKIKNEVFSKNCLSSTAKKSIYQNLYKTNLTFTIDKQKISGGLSASDDLDTLTKSFIHVVTETIFYENKLHLTEKIFKPIVARRPFILIGAAGNLQFLKEYGFKTFDKWIDESYDNESDPDKRLDMIIGELKKLCNLSMPELKNMQLEMSDILEFNFSHFFGNFKNILIDELVDNFKKIVIAYNAGKDSSFDFYVDHTNIDYQYIKNILSS